MDKRFNKNFLSIFKIGKSDDKIKTTQADIKINNILLFFFAKFLFESI